jgi:hypothetical protein
MCLCRMSRIRRICRQRSNPPLERHHNLYNRLCYRSLTATLSRHLVRQQRILRPGSGQHDGIDNLFLRLRSRGRKALSFHSSRRAIGTQDVLQSLPFS